MKRKMRPEDINDRAVNRIADKLSNMPCVPEGESCKPGDGVLCRICQTCGQPQLADEGLKCHQCGAEDITKKGGR